MANEPRIVYKSPRGVYAFGHLVDLSGFRYGQSCSRMLHTTPLAASDGAYDYDNSRLGVSMPNLSATDIEMWVAVFAHAWPDDVFASIGFVPFLRVVSATNDPTIDPTATIVTFLSNVGTLTGDFSNTDVLICTKNGGEVANKIVKALSNTTTTIKLNGINLGLSAGDYLLPAPPAGREYQYVCSLKLEYGGTTPAYGEWRNFSYSQRRAYSYHGQVGSDISSTTYVTVDFIHAVSPLATGVIGTLQAFWNVTGPGTSDAAYLILSRDTSNHENAKVGIDRLVREYDGVTAPFMCAFGELKQKLYAKVNHSSVKGRVTCMGWVEE